MLTAVKEVFERFVFDPSVVDLVLWYPYLNWHDFMVSTATVLAWRIASDRMERWMSFYLRRACSRGLLRLALMVKPEGLVLRPQAPDSRLRVASKRAASTLSRRWARAA